MKASEWITEVIDGDTVNAAASKAGIVTSTLARQLDRGEVSAENLILVSRAYGRNPIEALADCGFLTPDEINTDAPLSVLKRVPDIELSREILRRAKLADEEGRATVLDRPLDEAIKSD